MIANLFAVSGLSLWLRDVREFLSQVTFARPVLLWLTIVPLVLAVLIFVTSRRRRSRYAQIGKMPQTSTLRLRWFDAFVVGMLWSLFVLGVAGPQWGRENESGIAVGRDIVIVLDFSRSMWADDLTSKSNNTRWQAAVGGARELIETLRTRGGHRVAIVLFAARPLLLVPLTTDYDHLDFRLSELDATVPPAEIRPADDNATSGTRIGSAIRSAIETHDARFPGFQDILLFTDGDDPANDGEWRTGITAARNARIPIFVVGLGHPTKDSFILQRDVPIEVIGENGVPVPVQTRLNETLVESIAVESLGAYLPSRTDTPRVGEFYRAKMESNATREVSDERLPQPKDRSAWFLGIAAVLVLFVWWRER